MHIRELKKESELRSALLRNRVEHMEILDKLKDLNQWYANGNGRKAYERELKRLEYVDTVRKLMHKLTWEELGYHSLEEVCASNMDDAVMRFIANIPNIGLKNTQMMSMINQLDKRTGNILGSLNESN